MFGFSESEDAVKILLRHIGEDTEREGLIKTPTRVVRALQEMTAGYHLDPASILGTIFEEDSDEMIILRDIAFTSLCEHHMLPFVGTVDIGYIPSGKKIVGVSKLVRLVECFSKRLQVQERLTRQIAHTLYEHEHLKPIGVAVVIRAAHECMGCRGVRQRGTTMITSCMKGAFSADDSLARGEFLELTR